MVDVALVLVSLGLMGLKGLCEELPFNGVGLKQ